ncbi:MAG: low molecular weight phosphotyrosine protein phosphatase [Gammaproteobacteria bacterium]|nr:low molecular weight phosphotyrosine protein phosphatase [Gammaproteobacteria bacterium]
MAEAVRVLFVCTGNLCRSPLAQYLFNAQLAASGLTHLAVAASAGTHARMGQPAPPLLLEIATARGLDLSNHRSRRLVDADYATHDELIALDLGHLDQLNFLRPSGARARLSLLLSGVDEAGQIEVPDPFGGPRQGYERAAHLIELGVRHWLRRAKEATSRGRAD